MIVPTEPRLTATPMQIDPATLAAIARVGVEIAQAVQAVAAGLSDLAATMREVNAIIAAMPPSHDLAFGLPAWAMPRGAASYLQH